MQLAELLAECRIVTGSDVDLAQVPLGVGVCTGTPRPDISTVNAFKQTLLRAKSIGMQSTSGMYLKSFPKLENDPSEQSEIDAKPHTRRYPLSGS